MNFIEGFALSNYRSFGAELQKIGPCSKINIIIGKNNSGKSNILRFIKSKYGLFNKVLNNEQLHGFSIDDSNQNMNPNDINLGIGLILSSERINKYYSKLLSTGMYPILSQQNVDTIKLLLHSNALNLSPDMAWCTFQGLKGEMADDTLDKIRQELNNRNVFRNIPTIMDNMNIGRKENWRRNINDLVKKIFKDNFIIPIISLIPAFREIADDNTTHFSEVLNGYGLIAELAKLKSPHYKKMEELEKFLKIQDFVQEITDYPDAQINIPIPPELIQIDLHNNHKDLPLQSMGTGLHEVIILAAACTILSNQVICIEEPELHLHPLLQKKFLQYITKNTDNQYFISTHSAHLLDTPRASIFHITLENGESKVSPAYEISEKSSICTDLGYRPSDLFQTNCIIWVEGPSDRVYLKYWIEGKDADLEEGLHYSIMFYGGRLLSHLSSEDSPLIDDFISLRKLNRRIMIVMDSDKKKPNQWINPTKRRIKAEFEKNNEVVWVTKGREIENYLEEGLLIEIITSVHPRSNVECLAESGTYGCVVKYKNKKGEEKDIDKLLVAKKYIELESIPNYLQLDLETQINQVVKFIKESNNIQ